MPPTHADIDTPTTTTRQRKRNANQPRPNAAASQPNSSNSATQPPKKTNKPTANPNPNPITAKVTTAAPAPKPASPPIPQPEPHAPLKGFNAAEIDTLLHKGLDLKAHGYKSAKPLTPKTGPWGQKPGTMATGKDFWLELRKQVGTLQKGESTNKGG